jgi:hypothetical protein
MKMTLEQRKFEIYLTALRFIAFKVTENLRRICLDIDELNKEITLTAYYKTKPSELENELLDDICTNSKAHLPEHSVEYVINYEIQNLTELNHEFVLFSVYEPY